MTEVLDKDKSLKVEFLFSAAKFFKSSSAQDLGALIVALEDMIDCYIETIKFYTALLKSDTTVLLNKNVALKLIFN